MIGLAPWEIEFYSPGILILTFLVDRGRMSNQLGVWQWVQNRFTVTGMLRPNDGETLRGLGSWIRCRVNSTQTRQSNVGFWPGHDPFFRQTSLKRALSRALSFSLSLARSLDRSLCLSFFSSLLSRSSPSAAPMSQVARGPACSEPLPSVQIIISAHRVVGAVRVT